MHHFQFYNPVKILFGAGQIINITNNIPQGSKVLMIYGGGSIKKNGIYDQVKKALFPFISLEFGGVEANPRYETLMKAVELVRKEKIDFLLAVGGGSVIDGTKFIAAATYFTEVDPYTICSQGAKVEKAVPFGSVLTLPATGSEMNCGGVISRNSTQEKFAFHTPLVFPQFSILDPTLTISLPKRQRINGVVDAFIHVTEQYLTYPVQADIQDRFAEAILSTLIDNGKNYVDNPEDMDAASNIVWASSMALNGLIAVGVPEDWGTHMIGHEITALEGLDHAQTLALVWPGLQRSLEKSKHEKLLQFASRIWGVQDTELGIEKTEHFFRDLGMGTRISDYPQLSKDFIDKIVQRFKEREAQLGERGEITYKVVKDILESRK
ncbi:MAG: iron-containing alcohol dehydrogenase [Bacteroidales bacterium]